MISDSLRPLILASGLWALLATGALADDVAMYHFLPESALTYLVTHPMHRSLGTSHHVEGSVKVRQVGKAELEMPLTFSAPINSFKTGSQSRDRNTLVTLDAEDFPNATVVLTSVEWANQTAEGNKVSALGTAKGSLSLHGVTRPLTVPLKGYVNGQKLEVETQFSFRLADFQIERPALFFIPLDDLVTIDFQGVAER